MKEMDLVIVLPTQEALKDMQQERFEVGRSPEQVSVPEQAFAAAAAATKGPSKVR